MLGLDTISKSMFEDLFGEEETLKALTLKVN